MKMKEDKIEVYVGSDDVYDKYYCVDMKQDEFTDEEKDVIHLYKVNKMCKQTVFYSFGVIVLTAILHILNIITISANIFGLILMASVIMYIIGSAMWLFVTSEKLQSKAGYYYLKEDIEELNEQLKNTSILE